jgi:hypothetical protein
MSFCLVDFGSRRIRGRLRTEQACLPAHKGPVFQTYARFAASIALARFSDNNPASGAKERVLIMSWTERFSLIIVTAIFSLVGGAAAEHFWPGAVPELGAASIAKNVSAHRFTLIGDDGATRAELDVTAKGVAELRLLDDTGKLRAGLGVAHDGAPALGLYDSDGKTRAEVSLSRGVSRVRLFDQKGAPRMGMAVNDGGASNITLVDDKGGQRASMETTDAGESTLRLSDATQPRIGLSVTPTGTAGIALLGGGITHAALSLDQQNRAALFIYGADGKLVASVPQ